MEGWRENLKVTGVPELEEAVVPISFHTPHNVGKLVVPLCLISWRRPNRRASRTRLQSWYIFFASGIDEYEGLDAWIKRMMSFGEYIHLKERRTTGARGHYRGGASNQDVQKIAGKVTLPNFDGSAKSSTRAWIQKLDTYFHLNPMRDVDAIGFATLHLEGDAREWWYHGLIMLGHIHITTYTEFIRRLLERFERKDLELHFKELAHLRQTGSAEVYITEFQRLAVMVTDVLEAQLIMLFMEGLFETLHGWVRAYKPTSLQDAIFKTWDMIDAVPKNWAFVPTRPTAPQGNRDARPPQRDGGLGQLDDDTQRDLVRRRLCFTCQEP